MNIHFATPQTIHGNNPKIRNTQHRNPAWRRCYKTGSRVVSKYI